MTSSGKPLIEVRNLAKVYKTPAGEFTALKGIDVDVHQGEFVAIIGKSGSGKSTFINLLTGIDRPTSGEIVIGGAPIHTYNEGQMAAWRGRNLGIVFQFFQLLPTLTLLENILLPMELNDLYDDRWRVARGMHLLERVEMVEHADKFPAAISGGQQQRVAIARALANDPPLIVADEPTGNLDSKTAEKIFKLFEGLSASGKTVLMVTHDNDLAHRVNRTLLISDGEIVNEYLVRALATLNQDQLAEVARRVTPQVFPRGADIVRQGETGDEFYILVEGEVDVLFEQPGGGQVLVNRLHPGNYFGEMALLGNGIRAATVRASGEREVRVVALDNAAFTGLIHDSPALRDEMKRIIEQRALANQMKALSPGPQADRTVIARGQKRRTFAAGETILRQGEMGESFFIIEDGRVDLLVRNNAGEELEVNQLSRGQYFGEMALLGDHRRNYYSVRAGTDGPVHLIEFGAEDFGRTFGSEVRDEAEKRKIEPTIVRKRKGAP